MSERLPWFRCFPSALLGALAGLDPDEGLVYVTTLLRIYETGGPVMESARTLARRTGMNERRAGAALERLLEAQKVMLTGDGRLDSGSTHLEIEWQRERHKDQSTAGKASAAKRAEKHADGAGMRRAEKAQQNQQNGATPVERPPNHLEEEQEQKKDKPSSAGGKQPKAETAKSPRGSFLPTDWQPSDEGLAFAIAELGDEHLARRELMKFRNYWFGRSGEAGRKRDWPSTWQNWVMKEADNGSGHRNRSQGGSAPARGGRGGTSFDVVATGLASLAGERGIRPGGRQNGSGHGNGSDHETGRDDPEIEDAECWPASGYRAAHH